MSSNNLGLRSSPATNVFRALVGAIQTDPTLAGAVRRWRTWNGSHDDWREPSEGELPCVELLVGQGADEFYGPSTFVGPLVVELIVYCGGCDQDDPLDLYWAIKRAVYPADDVRREVIQEALVAAGAQGRDLVRFTSPSFAPVIYTKGERQFHRLIARGELTIPVIDLPGS